MMHCARAWRAVVAAGMGLSVLAASSLAQETKPADAPPPPPPPKRVGNTQVGPIKDLSGWPARPALPEIKNADVAAAVAALTGYFESAASAGATGEIPPLALGAARVDVTGLDNAVYFEVSRKDAPDKPFRQGVMHVYAGGGGLRLRIFDLAGQPTLGDAVTGLWLAPDVFPAIRLEHLAPNVDIPLKKEGTTWSGKTEGRVPARSAWLVESAIRFGGGRVSIADRGFDREGAQVFGVTEGKPIEFRSATSAAKVERLEGGLVSIDLVPGDPGPVAKDGGGRIAVHYTGWLHSDGWKFASSLDLPWNGAPIEPQVFTLPGRMLSGWSIGIPGLGKHGVRRLVMPSGLAFGNVGSPQWKVPPNTGVVFEVRCMYVEDRMPEAPASAPAEPSAEANK